MTQGMEDAVIAPMGMNRHYADKEPTRAEIDAMHEPLVLEFGTPWCGYCRAAQPLLEAALGEFPDIRHIKIEDGKGKRLGRSFGIKLWPTLVVMRGGEEIERLVRPDDIEAMQAAVRKAYAAVRQEAPAAPHD